MIDNFLVFLGLLIVLAALVRQDFVFAIVYMLAGAYLVGGWWSRRALAAVTCKREFPGRAFLDEPVPVRLEIANTGWLPVVWLRVYDSFPVDLSLQKNIKQVLSLGPYEKTSFQYTLNARKRGYYSIGPLLTASGDLLGLTQEQHRQGSSDPLIVYPKIIPLPGLRLPSNSPMGTMRHTQPIYEDPSRVFGKRDYVAGDSLRRVDWKSSAVSGRLQVKQFEPSIALETAIFLNLNLFEYDARSRIDSTELGIVIASSIANWVTAQKQSIGLVTNGLDPLGAAPGANGGELKDLPAMQPVPVRKGRGHLMRILDLLARVQAGKSGSLVDLIRQQYLNLPWGTTMIVITGQVNDDLYDTLFEARRAGLHLVLIMIGPAPDMQAIRGHAEAFKFPVYFIANEHDLDIWRR